jgi:putative lipoic acid-binding regulatory protein
MIDLDKHKLELNYPCNWTYKLVIRHDQDIKIIVKEVLDELDKREHGIQASKTSKEGKFKSYSLDLIVEDEDDRKALYKLLADHEHIKMIV